MKIKNHQVIQEQSICLISVQAIINEIERALFSKMLKHMQVPKLPLDFTSIAHLWTWQAIMLGMMADLCWPLTNLYWPKRIRFFDPFGMNECWSA